MDPGHLSLDLMCPEMFTGGFVYLIYGALCMLPVSLHLVEDMKWRYLR